MRVRLAVTLAAVAAVLGASCQRSEEDSAPAPSTSSTLAVSTTTTIAPATPCARREARPVGWQLTSALPLAQPLVVGDTLIVGTRGEKTGPPGCVVGVSAATGEERWRIDEPMSVGGTAVGAGDLAVVALARRVVGIDLTTGEERWSVPVRTVQPLAAGDGFVVAGDLDRSVAVDPGTGKVLWERPGAAGGAVADGASVFVSETEQQKSVTRSLDGKTGAVKWSVQAADGNAVVVAAGPQVVAAEQAPNTLAVIDRRSGRQLWTLNVPGSQSATPVPVGDTLVVRADDGHIYAYDNTSRTPHWMRRVGGARAVRPALAGGLVFTTGFLPGPTLFGLDARSGSERWKAVLPTTGGNEVTPTLVLGSLVAVGAGGAVMVFEQASGKQVVVHDLDQGVLGEMASFERTLFVRAGSASVVALPV